MRFAAVAEIALRRDDGFGDREQLLGHEETDHVREPRVGVAASPWRRAEAAADGQVEALEHAVLDDRDEAEIVREDVDVVERRHGDRGLELARQVGGAVDRLGLGRARDLLAVEPDLVIGARPRQQVLRELRGPVVNLGVSARDSTGFALAITLRLTSPQAAIVSISAALIAAIVAFSSVLTTPWS